MTDITDSPRRSRGQGSIYFDATKDRWIASVTTTDGRRRKTAGATRDEVEAKLADLRDRYPVASAKSRGRRPNGDGSIYFDATKQRWKGAVTLPNGRRRTVTGATQSEAASKLRAVQTQLGSGVDLDDGTTVAEYLAWWLDAQDARVGTAPGDLSVNTLLNYRWALGPVTDQLGRKRLAQLTPGNVEWLLKDLPKSGRSARNSVSRVRSVLGKALDDALARGMVARNVARLAKMPYTAPTAEQRSLTRDQAMALLETAAGTDVEAFVVVGLFLGLRPGELLGLCWDAVDLDARTLEVRRAMKREPAHNGRTERQRLGEVKTRRSRRTLDLPEPAVAALRAHRRRQKETQLAAPYWNNPDDLVFTTNVGTPVQPANMARNLAKVTEAAGLGRWSMTELGRHTAASLMHDAGMTLEQIAEVYGHAGRNMLERHYVHRVRGSIDHHVKVMETVFGP